MSAPADGPSQEPGQGNSQTGSTETILIVEDDKAVRSLMKIILERQGYRIIEAADGIEALKCWDRNQSPIQLVLTDMMMPAGMSGQELARQLRQRAPGLKVIFTTGYSAELTARHDEVHETECFLPKPWTPQQLLETVRRCLDK